MKYSLAVQTESPASRELQFARTAGHHAVSCIILRCVVISLIFPAPSLAADAPIGIADTDRVVFYGDKLVDPPGYGYMVESFIAVKYPTSKAKFWHVGTGGYDKTETANQKFDAWIAPLKPTVIVLCWGMGDGDMKKPSDEGAAKAAVAMEELIGRCTKLGTKVFVVTPPMPTIAKKNILSVNQYDVTILKIAEAISRVAKEKGAVLLDWYAACDALQKSDKAADLTDKDGMYPSAISNSLAAKLILEAWHLEPINVTVDLDWVSGQASASSGTASGIAISEDMVRLELKNFPMPWHTGAHAAAYSPKLACANFCKMTFKVTNVPDGTVALNESGERRKPVTLDAKILRDGYNLALDSPVTRNKPFREFTDLIDNKNKAFSGIERFRQQYIEAKPPEPELMESFQTQLLSRKQYHEGMLKLIDRTPRTQDVIIDMQLTPAGGSP